MNVFRTTSVIILCFILLFSSIAVSSIKENSVEANESLNVNSREGAPAAVEGYITYVSDSSPISGVYVGGEGDYGEAFTYSDANGYYCLNITEGEWYIQYNQTDLSGYSEEVELAAGEVLTIDVSLDVDTVMPVINNFDISITDHISTSNSALVELEFVEEYYRVVEVGFGRIIERSNGMMSLMPITSYTNSDDHPPVHSRDIVLEAGAAPGEYSTSIDWNAATTGYKIYREGGQIEGSLYDYGAFVPEDNRMGGGYSMIMGYYGKEGYESDAPGAIFLHNGVITDFYYMGQGDQGQVDLSDATSTIQFASFYYTTPENFQSGGGGPPEMGYKKLTDPMKINDIILEPCDYAPSGDYIVTVRVEDWGHDEDDFRYYEITVDTDSPVALPGGSYEGAENDEILIDGRDSHDEHSEIINYTWTITLPSSTETVYGSHFYVTFMQMGDYPISLKVTDAGLNTAEAEANIIVTDGTDPVAAVVPGMQIYQGDKIVFDGSASSDNVGIVNYTWSLKLNDDIVNMYGAEVHYTFEKIGNYTLKLTVFDSKENHHSSTTWVDVIERPPSDTTPPEVIESEMVPTIGKEAVSIDIIMEIPFNEELNITSLKFELLYEDSDGKKHGVEGYMVYNYDLYKITFSPSSYLEYGTVYTLKLSVADLFENLLEGYHMSFTTGPAPLPPPPDNDNDDIPDAEDTDDDNDGLPDIWEAKYDLDPFNASDAEQDSDGDGLSNAEEYSIGTNPSGSDSDGDGIPDDWEVDNGMDATDSSDADMDGDSDGKNNLEEYQSGSDPLVPEQTSLDKSKGDDKGGISLYIILAVVIAIIAVLVIYTLFMRKPKPSEMDSRHDEDEVEGKKKGPGSRPVKVRKAVRPKSTLLEPKNRLNR